MSANAIDTVCVQNCTSEFLKKMFFMLINLGYFFFQDIAFIATMCVLLVLIYPLKTDQTAACSLQTFNS